MSAPTKPTPQGSSLSPDTATAAGKRVCNFGSPGLHYSQAPPGWLDKEALKSHSGLVSGVAAPFLPL